MQLEDSSWVTVTVMNAGGSQWSAMHYLSDFLVMAVVTILASGLLAR